MRWRWPPWRREEPDVHEIERSGATVARAREQTEVMTEQILRRSGEVEKAGMIWPRSCCGRCVQPERLGRCPT
jgi:hypothetical protein